MVNSHPNPKVADAGVYDVADEAFVAGARVGAVAVVEASLATAAAVSAPVLVEWANWVNANANARKT